MIDGIHCNTTSLGPRVALDSVLVIGTTGFEEGFVDTATTCNDTDGSTAFVGDDLLCTGRELDAGFAIIGVLAENNGVVSWCKLIFFVMFKYFLNSI